MKKLLVCFLVLALMVTGVTYTAFAAEVTEGDQAQQTEQTASLDGMFEKLQGKDVSRTSKGMVFASEVNANKNTAFQYVTSEKVSLDPKATNSDRDMEFSFRLDEFTSTEGARQVYFVFTDEKAAELDLVNGVYAWLSDGVLFGEDQNMTFNFSKSSVVSGSIHRENAEVWTFRANGAQVFIKNRALLEQYNAAGGFFVHILLRTSADAATVSNAKMTMISFDGNVLGKQTSSSWIASNGSKANAADMYNEAIPTGHAFMGKSNYMTDANGDYTALGVIAMRNALNEKVEAAELDGYTFSYSLETTSTNAYVYLGFANINWAGNTVNDDRMMANEMMDFPLGIAAVIRVNPHSFMEGQSGAVNVQMRTPVPGMTEANNPQDLTQEQMAASYSVPTTTQPAEPVNGGHTITFLKLGEDEEGNGEWGVSINGTLLTMTDQEGKDFSATFNTAMNAFEQYGAYPVLQVADLDQVNTPEAEPIDVTLTLKGLGSQQQGKMDPTIVMADAPAKPADSDVTETSIRFTFEAPDYPSKYWTIGGYVVKRVGQDNSEKEWKLDVEDELVIEDTGLAKDTKYFYYISAVVDETVAEPVELVRYGNLVVTTDGGTTTDGGSTEETTTGGCSGSAVAIVPIGAALLAVAGIALILRKKA